ncbi:MAG: lysophospholipid acyltransferase family protein [Phenylobacterium sp.]
MTDLPAKLGQRLLWRIEALAFDCAQLLSRCFPIDAVSDFGGWLLRRVGPLTSPHRVAETNLRIVFPDASEAEIGRLLDAQWEEFGRYVAEFLVLDRIAADPGRVEIEGAERLKALSGPAGPAVLISGHFSNFEVMAMAIVRCGVKCQVTYRALNNPHLDRRVVESRRSYGVSMFAPKGLQGARELFRAIKRGESISLLNDQKFNGGVAGPLFGVTAMTAPGPSTYALHHGIPIQPMSVQRRDKARFRVIVHEPFRLADTGDRDADVEAGVRRINAFMEERILARPAEWFWVHRRWPNEVYKRRTA